MSAVAATAPWVEFRKVSEEDRQATVDSGHYVAKDVDYAFITPAGSKDCVEKPAQEWLDGLQTQVENNRFPAEWHRAFKAMYKEWKETGEIPIEGTSVKNWAIASPAQVEMLLKIHVRTVEQLAAANEEVIGKLGMGGRGLVDKAKAYVSQQTSGVGKISEENATLRRDLEQSTSVAQQQQSEIDALRAQVQALMQANGQMQQPSTVAEQSSQSKGEVGLSDLLDENKANTSAPKKL